MATHRLLDRVGLLLISFFFIMIVFILLFLFFSFLYSKIIKKGVMKWTQVQKNFRTGFVESVFCTNDLILIFLSTHALVQSLGKLWPGATCSPFDFLNSTQNFRGKSNIY